MVTLFHQNIRTIFGQTFALSKVQVKLISSTRFPLERKSLRITQAVKVTDNQYSEMHLGNLVLINFEWSEMWKLHSQSEQGLRARFSKASLYLRIPLEGLTHWCFHLSEKVSFTTFIFLQMKKFCSTLYVHAVKNQDVLYFHYFRLIETQFLILTFWWVQPATTTTMEFMWSLCRDKMTKNSCQ